MKRIYIAGKMTGLPDNGYPAFDEAARRLRALGFEVENPAENAPPPCGTWLGWMRMAVRQLALCDEVAFLPGWMSSRGAGAEFGLARDLGLPTRPIEDFLSGGDA